MPGGRESSGLALNHLTNWALGLPWGPVVETLSSNPGCAGSIPGWGIHERHVFRLLDLGIVASADFCGVTILSMADGKLPR